MGWTGYPYDRRKAVDIVRDELEGSRQHYRVLANSGAKYWVVEELATEKKFGVVALVERHNGDIYTKIVDETMGPNEVAFPLHMLNMLSETDSEYALNWRESVREYHAAKKTQPKLSVGDTIIMDTPVDFTNGLSCDRFTFMGGYRFSTPNGYRVRLPKNWRTTYKWEVKQTTSV